MRGWLGRVLVGGVTAGVLACPMPRGGWDLARLLAEEPALVTLRGARLGDLTPHPVVSEDSVDLVACRWPALEPIRVRLAVTGVRLEWARRAIESLSQGSARFTLETFESRADPTAVAVIDPGSGSWIDVVEVPATQASGPFGIGDTRVHCDGTPTGSSGSSGQVTGAEIRMRTGMRDFTGEVRPVPDADWTGVFLHELGHALGFQGHVRSGPSVLVLEESRLRAVGRRVLEGEVWQDATLEALYHLEPGRILGRRSLSGQSRAWVEAITAYLDGRGTGPWSSVGDRDARLEWRDAEGSPVRLDFPDWLAQVEGGQALVARPDPETRRRVSREASADGS